MLAMRDIYTKDKYTKQRKLHATPELRQQTNRTERERRTKEKKSDNLNRTVSEVMQRTAMLTSTAIFDCDKNWKMMITIQYRKNETLI